MAKENWGAYIHIPFCVQKCRYCDFTSYRAEPSFWEQYIESLALEIALQSQVLSFHGVDTIFFGGGTPSLLGPERLEKILKAFKENFAVTKDAEITLEVNPETVCKADWQAYRQAGFTRASIGVQSLQAKELAACGRIHRAEQARLAVYEAAEAGFTHLNVDLMYGLPEQSLKSLQETLLEVASWPIDHLSIYGLQIEAGTPFFQMERDGELALPSPIEEEAMYDWLQEFLPVQGFGRYEISNFARPGGECRHNLKYWRYQPYLGFGAAACGFDGEKRYNHPEGLEEYFEWLEKFVRGEGESDCLELLSPEERQGEFCFMGLRTTEGISPREFEKRFGFPLEKKAGKGLEKGKEKGWLKCEAGRIVPTPEGLRFNNLLAELFL